MIISNIFLPLLLSCGQCSGHSMGLRQEISVSLSSQYYGSSSNVFTLTGFVIVAMAVNNNQCWPSSWTGDWSIVPPVLWLALAKYDHYCLVSVMTVTPMTPCLNVSTLPQPCHTTSQTQIWTQKIFWKTRIKTIVLFEFVMKRADFYEISSVSSEKERKNRVIIYQIN